MEKIKTTNMPSLSVDKIVNLLTKNYLKIYEKNGEDFTSFPSVMLWGAPGVGKSQGVKQIAENLSTLTKLPVNVIDVRLLLFNPIDLRGIPVADQEKRFAVWLKPKIFRMSSIECINILFLDEISAAPQSVQAAAYQITLDRKVGEHELPNNCIIIAAGNRVTDKSVAVKMPKALANRLLHLEVDGNFSSWKKWAVKNNINSNVISFLSNNENRLFGFNSDCDDLAFPTPRTWEMVSNILDTNKDNFDEIYPLIAGLVGSGVASEFIAWCKSSDDLPNIEGIFNGTELRVPKKLDTLYLLINMMTSYASNNKYDDFQIGNSIRYATLLPSDFAELLIQNYSAFDTDYINYLKQIPEYFSFANKKGNINNGNY